MTVKRAEGTPYSERFEVMTVKTAAALYDLKPQRLQLMCTRGIVKGNKVGRDWFITPEEMDRVFKGIEPLKGEGKVASKKASKVGAQTRKEGGR